MAGCSKAEDAFRLAERDGAAMNVAAVIQHTAGEYLGLIEDHLEGRGIRFQYFRPFAAGGLPAATLPADALILLGGGPWGAAGERDLPTLRDEVELVRQRLSEGTPVIGFGLGAVVLSLAAGGDVEQAPREFQIRQATRTDDNALNGYLPAAFHQVTYLRDRPLLPQGAGVLAVDDAGRASVFRVGDNAYGFLGHPGIKLGMIEDLIMEFDEVPDGAAGTLDRLRPLQPRLEDELVPIMTGLVQCTSLMSTPKAAAGAAGILDT
jgi:GMP synthase-like glutamine amidotransferase